VERKPVKWLGTTLEDIRNQSEDIQDQLGYQLDRVQLGLRPNNYRPMSTVGPGTVEIRVADAANIARLMYVAKFRNTVHVLHVFTKKSQTTPQSDIKIAKQRYKEAKGG
jgi:phage-related protein